MRYTQENGIHIVEVPVKDFRIILCDTAKTACGENYANGGFFGNYSENGEPFTLPAGHLVCDYAAQSQWTKKYCTERGSFAGEKFTFDSGSWNYANALYGHAVSTLVISGGKARVEDAIHVPECEYAIAGVPILRGGEDVKFATYVTGQGWDASVLYPTWHTFVGLKSDASVLYVMGMKTTTANMILSAEAYRKCKALGFTEVLKLDGGGSFHMDVGGKTVQSTSENRRINTILSFAGEEEENTVETNTGEINVYSKGQDGSRYISGNFQVKEFACSDGSDPVFVAPALVQVLQKIRDHFGKAVTINSGFRTASHNKSVGGATYSQHLYGRAADIVVKGVAPEAVAAYAETLLSGTGGIGRYASFTHVDVRKNKSRWNG